LSADAQSEEHEQRAATPTSSSARESGVLEPVKTEAAYTAIAALEEEVAADDAQRARFRARAADSTS
jgi:hypothetical protein